MEDIFSKSEDTADAFKEMTEEAPKANFKSKTKENYWDKQDIQPMEIDPAKYSRTGKSFVVYVHPDNDIPADAADRIAKVAKGLMDKGYVFRHTGSADNALQNQIIAMEGATFKTHLPWKGFNKGITDPILANGTGYRIAVGIHKSYMKLPASVRAILSRDVNAITGEEATDPVDFIITWTDGGDEFIGKNVDFKKIGNNTFILMLAKRATIPVVNVYNDSFLDKLKTLIK